MSVLIVCGDTANARDFSEGVFCVSEEIRNVRLNMGSLYENNIRARIEVNVWGACDDIVGNCNCIGIGIDRKEAMLLVESGCFLSGLSANKQDWRWLR